MLQGKNKTGLQPVSKPVEPVIPKNILDKTQLFLDEVHDKCYKVKQDRFTTCFKTCGTGNDIFYRSKSDGSLGGVEIGSMYVRYVPVISANIPCTYYVQPLNNL